MALNLTFLRTRLLPAISLTAALLLIGFLNAQAQASISAGGQQVPTWERYQVPDEGFSVELPAVPAMSQYKLRPEPVTRSRLMNLIGAYSQGVVYAISVFERKQSLENFISSEQRSAPDDQRDLNLAGIRGEEYSFRSDAVTGRTQYFITDRRIYVFKAWGSVIGKVEIGIPRFFDSIKFDKGLTAQAIDEGPGVMAKDVTGTSDKTSPEVFTGKQVEHKALVITKPEPVYTDDARKYRVSGTVVLKGLFSSRGAVEELEVLNELPQGLTEKAIAAALQIKFIPPIKNGHFVSMYMHLEYNFNLY